MAAGAKRGGALRVRQVRSGIGYNAQQRATLRALGLDRVGKTRELPDHPQVRGMIASVSHLVRIERTDAD
jgi:large subunit ribosomal protein L30